MLSDTQNELISITSQCVKNELLDIESGHDWWHLWRVWQMSLHIGYRENADLFICSLAALLHDISDPKFKDTRKESTITDTREYLRSLGIEESICEAVHHITENISFSKGISVEYQKTIEFKVVQDADRLDAIGAIGIARAFNYGGYRNRTIHIPDTHLTIHDNIDEFRLNSSTTIMHFYEKLLLLNNTLNTQTARSIASDRHKFLIDFLNRFFLEWNEFSNPI
jgi:uncharacterized protein